METLPHEITRNLRFHARNLVCGLEIEKIEVTFGYDREDHEGTYPDTHIEETSDMVLGFLNEAWPNATEEHVEEIEEDIEALLGPDLTDPSVTVHLG